MGMLAIRTNNRVSSLVKAQVVPSLLFISFFRDSRDLSPRAPSYCCGIDVFS